MQILERIGCAEGLRSFAEDGLDCGFSRPEMAELFGTFFEDRLAEAFALAIVAGDYPDNDEFNERIAQILHVPARMFGPDAPGREVFPVDDAFLECFREALVAIEASYFRYVEGDYPSQPSVGVLLRSAHEDLLAANYGRAFDRVSSIGARVLEGGYLAKPTEWMETEPLYSWLLGLERISYVLNHLEGWHGGPYRAGAAADPMDIVWNPDWVPTARMTPARRDVLSLLRKKAFGPVELRRIKRNWRWLGPELMRLRQVAVEQANDTLLRNVIRSLGAIAYRPAVDDILALLMQAARSEDEADAELTAACEAALAAFAPTIKAEVLYHTEVAVLDRQRLVLARILTTIPEDDEVMDALRRLTPAQESSRTEMTDDFFALYEVIAGYPHPHTGSFLKEQLEQTRRQGPTGLHHYLKELLAEPRRGKRVSS